ncbi:MAG: hypothetical protein QM516_06330 [Limnohabitans sp.]|nr:hypothetical protein [Limnohabitans sp.]
MPRRVHPSVHRRVHRRASPILMDTNAQHPHETPALALAARAAVDYRGDVTVTLIDGSTVVGFAFDLAESHGRSSVLRFLDPDSGARVSIELDRVQSIALSGKDAASGKTWENWLRRYAEKKLAGEAASIESEPLA